MRSELEIIDSNLDLPDPDFSEKPILSMTELTTIIRSELSEIDQKTENLRKRKKILQLLFNKIKPYIKENKLRGSELLKMKGKTK